MSGPGHIEIFTMGATSWENDINKIKNFSDNTIYYNEPSDLSNGAVANGKFDKICIACMGVCAEEAEICPKCGYKF